LLEAGIGVVCLLRRISEGVDGLLVGADGTSAAGERRAHDQRRRRRKTPGDRNEPSYADLPRWPHRDVGLLIDISPIDDRFGQLSCIVLANPVYFHQWTRSRKLDAAAQARLPNVVILSPSATMQCQTLRQVKTWFPVATRDISDHDS
jgi:hypothetical protein